MKTRHELHRYRRILVINGKRVGLLECPPEKFQALGLELTDSQIIDCCQPPEKIKTLADNHPELAQLWRKLANTTITDSEIRSLSESSGESVAYLRALLKNSRIALNNADRILDEIRVELRIQEKNNPLEASPRLVRLHTELSVAIRDFIESNRHDWRPKTLAKYQSILGEFRRFIGVRQILDINAADVQSYKNQLQSKEQAKRTVNDKLTRINAFFRWLVEFEYLPAVPFHLSGMKRSGSPAGKTITKAKVTPNPIPRLTWPDMADLCNVIDELCGLGDLFMFARLTGLRAMEIARLRTENIIRDDHGDYSVIVKAIPDENPKFAYIPKDYEIRIIPLGGKALEIASKHLQLAENRLKQAKESGDINRYALAEKRFLFVYPEGKKRKQWQPLDHHFSQSYMEKAIFRLNWQNRNPRPKFHDLRKNFAIDYLQAPDSDIESLRQLMGHADLKTLQVYISYVDTNRQRNIIDSVQKNVLSTLPAPNPDKIVSISGLKTR